LIRWIGRAVSPPRGRSPGGRPIDARLATGIAAIAAAICAFG
jgi:hypothetical protein